MAARNTRSTEKKIDPMGIAKRMIEQEMDLPIFIKHYISDTIGFGVFANMDIPKGSFLLEYNGELVDHCEGGKRETYAAKNNLGCFVYYFSFNGKQFCVDATYSSRMGKFVNDSSPSYANCFVKIISEKNIPHLCIFSKNDIPKYTELRYSYGETSGLTWRKLLIYKRPLMLTNVDNTLQTAKHISDFPDNIGNCNNKTTNCTTPHYSFDNQSVCKKIETVISPSDISSSILLTSEIDLVIEKVHTCNESVPQVSVSNTVTSSEIESESLKDIVLPHTSDIILPLPILLPENVDIIEVAQTCEQFTRITSVNRSIIESESLTDVILPPTSDIPPPTSDIKLPLPILLPENVDLIEKLKTCEQSTFVTSVNSVNTEYKDGNSIPTYIKCKVEMALALNNIDMIEEAMVSWKSETAQNLIKDSLDPRKSKNLKAKRRKVNCPKCERLIVNLKRHLMSVHQFSEYQAKAARVNFGLNITKKSASESYKKRKYIRRQCPIFSCALAPKRLENHLKQYHKLDKKRVKKYLLKASPILEDFPDEDNESSPHSDSSSKSDSLSNTSDNESDLEAKAKQEWFFTTEISSKGADFLNSSEDENWFAGEYMKRRGIHPKKKSTSASLKKTVIQPKIYTTMDNDLLSSRESESDDQSDKDFEDIEQPFILSSLEEDIFMNKFSDWLYSNDGGKKPRSTCSKHRSTIMGMVRSGDSPVDYKDLFNREFINIWMTKMQDAGREAGTIKTYLGSLVHFYNFVIISGDPRFDENDYNKIAKMKMVIKVWGKTLWKGIERRKYEKQVEDMKRFPTGEQVCNFDKCDLAKEAILSLKAFVADRCLKLNRKSYCLIRDFLIAQVLFDNASRPAAISNMTLVEFKNAVCQNDGVVVRVLHHKNDYKGPANITFQHEVYKRVQMYINFVCQRLSNVIVKGCDPVFLSFNGSKMDSSMITTQFSSFWNRGLGLPIEDRMIPTVVRKYTTTIIHNLNPSAKQDTADVLCHSLNQANASYVCQEKQNKASSSTKVIRATQRIVNKDSIDSIVDDLFEKEIVDKKIKITKSLVDEKICCDERFSEILKQPTKSKQILDSVRYKKVKFEKKENKEITRSTESNLNVEDDLKEPYEKRQRKDFTSSEVDAIYMYLGDYIYSQCKIERVIFEKYVCGIPELEFILKKFGTSSIITKIRTERKSPRSKYI